MAHPKRRHSRARRDKRRSQQQLTAPNLATCPQCGAARVPHRVCAACGYYRGRPVVQVAVTDKKK